MEFITEKQREWIYKIGFAVLVGLLTALLIIWIYSI